MKKIQTKLAVCALSLVLLSWGLGSAEEPNAVAHMAKMAGDWTFTNRMWLEPGKPPHEWTGTMHAEKILSGRFVQSVWKGNFMGMEYEGRGMEGYDNAHQYVSSWIDTMEARILLSTGTCEEAVNKCTTTRSAGTTTMKSVVSWIDNNNFKTEMFMTDPSGKESKVMEILVKRK